jgi:hypothetical protein
MKRVSTIVEITCHKLLCSGFRARFEIRVEIRDFNGRDLRFQDSKFGSKFAIRNSYTLIAHNQYKYYYLYFKQFFIFLN